MKRIKQHFMWVEYNYLSKKAKHIDDNLDYIADYLAEQRKEIRAIQHKLSLLSIDIKNALKESNEAQK